MNNNRFQRPSSSSSQEVSRYGQKSRTNYNGNGYNNTKFSQRNNNENSNNYSKFSQRNKFNSYEKNTFSNKFSQKYKTQYSNTKDTRISTNVSVNKPKETLVEMFPSLSVKTSTKPVVKPVEKKKQVDIKKTNNPWGKKNVIQHIKQCYQNLDEKRRIEREKRQNAMKQAQKKRNERKKNALSHAHPYHFRPAEPLHLERNMKKKYYDSENDDYFTDNNDDEEYMTWSSE